MVRSVANCRGISWCLESGDLEDQGSLMHGKSGGIFMVMSVAGKYCVIEALLYRPMLILADVE